jgi:hypothetical protein
MGITSPRPYTCMYARVPALRGIAIEAITDPYNPCEQLLSLENCALPGYYAGSSSNLLQTFGDTLSVPSSGVN